MKTFGIDTNKTDSAEVRLDQNGITILQPKNLLRPINLNEAFNLKAVLAWALLNKPDGPLVHQFPETQSEYRDLVAELQNELRYAKVGWAKALKNSGFSNVAIAKKLGVHESTIRRMLKK